MRIIGAGVGRTGTYSLKLALEKLLGGPCYHMMEVFEHPEHVTLWHSAASGQTVDWQQLFSGYAAGVDWPVCAFARELADVYPDAPVLLSVRDFEPWWESASTTIFPSSQRAEGMWKEMVTTLFNNKFTGELDNKEACRKAFERHYENIRKDIPASRIVEWRPGDGWEPICNALDLPVPDESFPHRNTTEEFLSRSKS